MRQIVKKYFILEGLLGFSTLIYVVLLGIFNHKIFTTYGRFDFGLFTYESFQLAWRISKEPTFWEYFIFGILFVALLIWSIYKNVVAGQDLDELLYINACISILLSILLLIFFWNPIFISAFLVILACIFGIGVVGNFEN